MSKYVAWRLVRMASVVFAISLFTFFLVNLLPGGPINAILGPAAGDPAARAQLTNQFGLNHPVWERYFVWLGHALQGNLGQSYISGQSVLGTIGDRVPFTIELMLMAEIISLVIAVPVAMVAALKPDGFFDKMLNRVTLSLFALPAFVLGPFLLFVFADKLHLVPAANATTWLTFGNPADPGIVATPQSILLPSLVLAAGQLAIFARVLRGDLVTTLKSEFILLARSKGFSRWRILFRHALRPSSFTLASLVGLSVGGLLGGALIVENIFGLPGMGTLFITSIEKRDYLMVQGIELLIASGFVVVNFLTDMLYLVIDPRVRRERLIG